MLDGGVLTITSQQEARIWQAALLAFYFSAIATGLLHWRLQNAMAMALACVIISYIMILVPADTLAVKEELDTGYVSEIIAMFLVIAVGVIVLWIGPPREVTLRTWGMIYAFLTIAALSEVSKIGFKFSPPT